MSIYVCLVDVFHHPEICHIKLVGVLRSWFSSSMWARLHGLGLVFGRRILEAVFTSTFWPSYLSPPFKFI